jgi:hypothetical protein
MTSGALVLLEVLTPRPSAVVFDVGVRYDLRPGAAGS